MSVCPASWQNVSEAKKLRPAKINWALFKALNLYKRVQSRVCKFALIKPFSRRTACHPLQCQDVCTAAQAQHPFIITGGMTVGSSLKNYFLLFTSGHIDVEQKDSSYQAVNSTFFQARHCCEEIQQQNHRLLCKRNKPEVRGRSSEMIQRRNNEHRPSHTSVL